MNRVSYYLMIIALVLLIVPASARFCVEIGWMRTILQHEVFYRRTEHALFVGLAFFCLSVGIEALLESEKHESE